MAVDVPFCEISKKLVQTTNNNHKQSINQTNKQSNKKQFILVLGKMSSSTFGLKEFSLGVVAFGDANTKELLEYSVVIFSVLLIVYLALFVDAQKEAPLPTLDHEVILAEVVPSVEKRAQSPVPSAQISPIESASTTNGGITYDCMLFL
jgi:hypothetical protein